MNLLQVGFLALLFLSVFAIVVAAMIFFSPSNAKARLHSLVPGAGATRRQVVPHSLVSQATRISQHLGKLSIPEEGWEASGLRTRFMNAGIRDASAPMAYFGAKTLLALSTPIVVYLLVSFSGAKLSLNSLLFFLLLGATVGYYLPTWVLGHLVDKRKREIFETFPDALDLMIVCVEAGLGIEAALNRVATDIEHKSKTLSEELSLVGLELRAGSDRARALRNLAARTGVEEVETWVAMLVQADRFGTSIAAALRVHSDMLRTKRRQRAEEQAAKIALKLLFPLIFFLFPSLMLVLMGPAFIQIYRVLLPTMAGGQ